MHCGAYCSGLLYVELACEGLAQSPAHALASLLRHTKPAQTSAAARSEGGAPPATYGRGGKAAVGRGGVSNGWPRPKVQEAHSVLVEAFHALGLVYSLFILHFFVTCFRILSTSSPVSIFNSRVCL